MIFNATPQAFDEGFFDQLTAPLEKVSGLMVDMENFLKQLEEVQMQSAMEKEKAEKTKKEKEVKDKKYKDDMAKVDELEKEGKFREAWMKVPDLTAFPEKAEEISKRKTSLSGKFATPNLFGATEETPEPPQVEEVTADDPAYETDEE